MSKHETPSENSNPETARLAAEKAVVGGIIPKRSKFAYQFGFLAGLNNGHVTDVQQSPYAKARPFWGAWKRGNEDGAAAGSKKG